jgi:hypothetical protein
MYKIFEKISFKLVTGKTVGPGCRHATMSRAPRVAPAHRPTLGSAPLPA